MPWDNTTGEDRIDPTGYKRPMKPRPGYASQFPRMPPAAPGPTGGTWGPRQAAPGMATTHDMVFRPDGVGPGAVKVPAMPPAYRQGPMGGDVGPGPYGPPSFLEGPNPNVQAPNLGQTVAASRPAMPMQADPRQALLRQLMGMG